MLEVDTESDWDVIVELLAAHQIRWYKPSAATKLRRFAGGKLNHGSL